MTFKKWLLIAVGLIILIVVLYYAFGRDNTATEKNTYISGENIVEYSPSGGPLAVLNKATGQFELLSDLSVEESNEIEYVSFSPNGDSYLYSSIYDYPSDQTLTAKDNTEARSIYLPGNSKPVVSGAYAPAWLSNDKVIYQDIASFELVTYSATNQEELSRNDFGLENTVEIYPLNENTVVVLPASYDVSEITSQVIYLDTLKTKDYLSGLGLQIKSILGTDLLAYQVLGADNKSQTTVVNWKTMDSIRTTGIYANAIVWDKSGNLKYWDYESSALVDLTAQ